MNDGGSVSPMCCELDLQRIWCPFKPKFEYTWMNMVGLYQAID